jgi:hypothetical protein
MRRRVTGKRKLHFADLLFLEQFADLLIVFRGVDQRGVDI